MTNEASNGSTRNAGMLNALLGMNSANGATATPNSANAPDSSASFGPSAAHRHYGISAYVTQLTNAAASAV